MSGDITITRGSKLYEELEKYFGAGPSNKYFAIVVHNDTDNGIIMDSDLRNSAHVEYFYASSAEELDALINKDKRHSL